MKHQNKRRERTQQLREAANRIVLTEQIQNHIEQHNFNKLVEQGVIREIRE